MAFSRKSRFLLLVCAALLAVTSIQPSDAVAMRGAAQEAEMIGAVEEVAMKKSKAPSAPKGGKGITTTGITGKGGKTKTGKGGKKNKKTKKQKTDPAAVASGWAATEDVLVEDPVAGVTTKPTTAAGKGKGKATGKGKAAKK